MDRRTFMRRMVQAVSLLAAAGFLFQVARKRSFPARIVRTRFPWLKVSDEDLDKFSVDYQENATIPFRRFLSFTAVLAPLYYGLEWIGRRNGQFRALEESVCQIFLLSTDFFRTGADESRTVKYVQFYNPHRFPCQNPFASFEMNK